MGNRNFYFTRGREHEGTVTDFHEWVWAKHDEKYQAILFYRENPNFKEGSKPESAMDFAIKTEMARSKILHDEIHLANNILFGLEQTHGTKSDWFRIYIDAHSDNDLEKEVLQASNLLVRGKPIRGCPDVVLKHRTTGEIIIIETKVTKVPLGKVPDEAYQNVRAQLWAYSHMDLWGDIPSEKILLVANFWNKDLNPPKSSTIWKKSDKIFYYES